MAGKIYVGNGSNKAKKPSKIYVGGSDNKAHLVKAIYVGDSSNKARKVWPMSDINDSRYDQLGWVTSYYGNIVFPVFDSVSSDLLYPRIVIEFSVPNPNSLYSYRTNGETDFISHSIQWLKNKDGITAESYGYSKYNFYMAKYQTTDNANFYCESEYTVDETGEGQYSYPSFNQQEGVIENSNYIIDFTTGGSVKLYNSVGYYSISSNNNVGTLVKLSPPSGVEGTVTTTIFNGEINNVKIFNVLFYNGSVIKHKFVPCYRISDNKLGFFDTVDRTFYPNKYKTTADTDYYGLM